MIKIEDLDSLHEKLKQGTLDVHVGIQVAGELAIGLLGVVHTKLDDLLVETNKDKVVLVDGGMKKGEAKLRVESTEKYREYLKWKHLAERINSIIQIAKKHSDIARGF